MSEKLLVPDIGDFEEVEVIEILVKQGDQIKENDPVVTIESDKSSVEIPSTISGKIESIAVKVGDKVSKGQVLTEGYATQDGELALGKNMKVAFMPWQGYNFEDAIIINENLMKHDTLTSVHIKEFEVEIRDTKRGEEELTPEIPNVSEEATSQLDEDGLIRVGAIVNEDDILIGKETPKGETDPSPEEKLLRAIFGEKAADVKDTSLRVPPGAKGTVVEIRVFSRRGVEKDERAVSIENSQIESISRDRDDELNILEKSFANQIKDLLTGKTFLSGNDKLIKNKPIVFENIENFDLKQLLNILILAYSFY